MNFKAWKLGAVVSILMSLFVAGMGLTGGMGWKSFVAVFCGACATHFGAFLVKHPVDNISFDTTTFQKTTASASGATETTTVQTKTPASPQPPTT